MSSYPKTYTFVIREGYEGASDRLYKALTGAGFLPTQTDYALKLEITNSIEDQLLRQTLITCHADCPYGRKIKGGTYHAICGGDGPAGVHCHQVVVLKK